MAALHARPGSPGRALPCLTPPAPGIAEAGLAAGFGRDRRGDQASGVAPDSFAASLTTSATSSLTGAALTAVAELSAPRAWDLWAEMRTNGLGPYIEPPQSMFQSFQRRVLKVFLVGLVLLAAGTSAAVVSIVLPGKARKP